MSLPTHPDEYCSSNRRKARDTLLIWYLALVLLGTIQKRHAHKEKRCLLEMGAEDGPMPSGNRGGHEGKDGDEI